MKVELVYMMIHIDYFGKIFDICNYQIKLKFFNGGLVMMVYPQSANFLIARYLLLVYAISVMQLMNIFSMHYVNVLAFLKSELNTLKGI